MADDKRKPDAISLLEKAVAIMPENTVYQESLRRARSVQGTSRSKIKS